MIDICLCYNSFIVKLHEKNEKITWRTNTLKKKILSTLLISSLMLSATALPLVASADTVDSKIESQDKKIADLKNKENSATSTLASIQGNISSIQEQASALQYAKPNVKCVIVANPANTNATILSHYSKVPP